MPGQSGGDGGRVPRGQEEVAGRDEAASGRVAVEYLLRMSFIAAILIFHFSQSTVLKHLLSHSHGIFLHPLQRMQEKIQSAQKVSNFATSRNSPINVERMVWRSHESLEVK